VEVKSIANIHQLLRLAIAYGLAALFSIRGRVTDQGMDGKRGELLRGMTLKVKNRPFKILIVVERLSSCIFLSTVANVQEPWSFERMTGHDLNHCRMPRARVA
jgi:hypothetical protein